MSLIGRFGFCVSELDEWLAGRPRKKGPEVNDNKKLVRCPQTPSELEEARQQDYAELKAKRQGLPFSVILRIPQPKGINHGGTPGITVSSPPIHLPPLKWGGTANTQSKKGKV